MLSLAVKALVESKEKTVTMLSQDAAEKCDFVYDIDFIDNVRRTMQMMRLLSFTTDAYDKRTMEELNQ